MIGELISRLTAAGATPALIAGTTTVTYEELHAAVARSEVTLTANGCRNTVVALIADYSLGSIAALLALWRLGNVAALLTNRTAEQESNLVAIAEVQFIIRMSQDDQIIVVETGLLPYSDLLVRLNRSNEAGFIIFSSGSTGRPKSAVHRTGPLLEKNAVKKRRLRSISFLLFDHIGGLNTLIYILFNRGVLVIPASRRPDDVAQAIEHHGVQSLTTSPSFLNLLLVSGVVDRYDLSSLEIINYGTEPMPETTLSALADVLPGVRFSQAYGLTETGVIPTRSLGSYSSWVQLGGPDCDIRIVDGLLEVRTKTSMLGYLGLPSPFTDDGYFRTGDAVEQNGEYVRILGRQSDMINVGGEKVYPAEIEEVLRKLSGVIDVTVAKDSHPLVGNIVTARFQLIEAEDRVAFRRRVFAFCAERLSYPQIPRKMSITTDPLHGDRFKKIRR